VRHRDDSTSKRRNARVQPPARQRRKTFASEEDSDADGAKTGDNPIKGALIKQNNSRLYPFAPGTIPLV
jgi:hypothetical protein